MEKVSNLTQYQDETKDLWQVSSKFLNKDKTKRIVETFLAIEEFGEDFLKYV